jgi:hypothetical protein
MASSLFGGVAQELSSGRLAGAFGSEVTPHLRLESPSSLQMRSFSREGGGIWIPRIDLLRVKSRWKQATP